MMLESSRVLVTPEGHIDVTRRADICANVTADTAGVISSDVAAHGLAVLFNAINRVLGAVNNTVITLETHTATHATSGFLDRQPFAQAFCALCEMTEHLFLIGTG